MASKLGRTVLIVVEKFSELALIAETAKKIGVRPAHRHPRQAGGQGLGALGGVGRRPVEVRPVDARGGRGDQLPARQRPAQLLRAAALPPRQPDLRHPRGQERAARGGPLLRRGVQARRAAQVLRRGRRSGRRLRRLADQLRVVDELHDAGVRQRHRVLAAEICDAAGVPHPTIVTESGRAMVAHHSMLVVDILGVGEFDVGKAPEQGQPATSRAWCKNLFETYQRGLAQERARVVPRRARVQGRGAAAVQSRATCRCPSGWSPRTSSGRSARSC